MARFNAKTNVKTAPDTVNLAGGKAYSQSNETELVSILLTSFVQDQFYRSGNDTMKRLIELLGKVDPKFAAKAAIYARNEFGMRTITHVLAAELAKYISGQKWSKEFYNKVVFRPDDMSEILAYYFSKGNKKLSNSLKKGFAKAFDKFDNYQLAKYKMENRDISLVDIVNLVHPVPSEKNSKGLDELINGTLKSTDTWEAKLSDAGQKAETEEEKMNLKKDAWASLIDSRKIGYFALLRNLRNIMEQAPEVLDRACALLKDEKLIKSPKNLVMPFNYLVAYKQFKNMNTAASRKIMDAIEDAFEISCDNVPSFDGNCLVVVDNSGSMDSRVSGSQHLNMSEAGALFALILAKKNNADLMEFGNDARYINYSLKENVMKFAEEFTRMNKVGHGTNFSSMFAKANKAYNKIFVFSDMQGWMNGGAPIVGQNEYCKKYNVRPNIFAFDLAGSGCSMWPEKKTYQLSGFSEKIFDIVKLLEQDRDALANKIKNYVDFD